MKNRHKIFFLLFSVVIIAVIAFLSPFQSKAGFGLSKNGFGGKISQKPPQIVTDKDRDCMNGMVCGGTNNSWASLLDESCKDGTFSLKPNFPKRSTTSDYCIPASADDRTKRTPAIAVGRLILGLHSGKQSTPIGICTCITEPYYYKVETVSVDLAKVTMFGTSR